MLMIMSVKIGIKCDSFGGFSLKTVAIRLKTTVFRSVSSIFVTKKSADCAACCIMALKKFADTEIILTFALQNRGVAQSG